MMEQIFYLQLVLLENVDYFHIEMLDISLGNDTQR